MGTAATADGAVSKPFVTDAVAAARNSVTLAAAVGVSWAIGLVGRLLIPRYLGPEMFGAFQFADYFASTFFVVSILGVDTYIRKEIGVRRAHASDFFGGLIVLRLLVSVLLVGGIAITFALTGKPAYLFRLVLLFSVYQVFSILNQSYSCMLSAVGSVGRQSVANVTAKLIWSAAIVASAAAGLGVQAFAAALTLSEIVKTVALTRLARRDLALRFRIDVERTRQVVLSSLPFWVVGMSGTIYLTADVTLMAFRTSQIEVGWYGAATSLVNIAMVLAPIIHNVFLPMTSVAATRSDADLSMAGRRSLEMLVSLIVPVALFGGIAADSVVALIFGHNFAPAAAAFRMLCPVIVLVYVAILPALMLTRLERGWTVTWVSIGIMALNLTLNWFAIPAGVRLWGAGGAGVAAALAWLVCEACNVAILFSLIADRMFDRRNVQVIAKTAGAAAAVWLLYRAVTPSWLSFVLLFLVYTALVVGTGAVRVAEVTRLVRLALRRPVPPAN